MTPAERKFKILTRILDGYVRQGAVQPNARSCYKSIHNTEERDQSRSRAYIHLYLEANYGIGDFSEREAQISDGSNDAGIDGYHIDEENRVIDIVQSKFRTNYTNFEQKFIEPTELAKIDIDRVLRGFEESESGNRYNGQILGLQRKMKQIKDIARYAHKLTIIANTPEPNWALTQRLFSDYELNVVNVERCYRELVLPVLRGEQYYGKTLRLQIDLSNKSSASRLGAEITTSYGPCEITVVLVPTAEIAELMSRYKNSILRYNPRSYLEFREQRTNEGIRDSIICKTTGEFALLNNGLTILSDDTYMNERVGARNRASVEIVNPQIINGGQTAFTLSRIFDESSDIERAERFTDKEVLVRIITLPSLDESSRNSLITEISSATNSQTQVSNVDRSASNEINREVAEHIFLTTGLLYEPRRGEYSNAIYSKYVERIEVLERSLFTRLIYIAEGEYALGVQKKMMRNTGGVLPQIPDAAQMSDLADLYSLFIYITGNNPNGAISQLNINLALAFFALQIMKFRTWKIDDDKISISSDIARALWPKLISWGQKNHPRYTSVTWNTKLGVETTRFKEQSWLLNKSFPDDVKSFINNDPKIISADPFSGYRELP